MTTTMTGCKRGGTLNSLPFLPFDLVAEILCRLSVKHLLQLCCVCKSWNSLISHDSQFAKKHLRFSTSSSHHLVLSSKYSSREFLLSDSAISSIFTSPSTTSFTQLSHPMILTLKHGHCGARVSTCHGMICFRIGPSNVLLCNPSIRKFKMLPPLLNPNPNQKYFHTSFTLVYDRFTNNYKIIALSSYSNHNKEELNVHTLGSDYWTKIQDFPNYYIIKRPEIFVSDTVNWLTCDTRSSTRFILSLHLEKELCQELLHPLYNHQAETFATLGMLRDCLCFLSNSHKFSDVWIMKEYGNGQSWTKLFRVPYLGDPCFYHYTRALYISEDDQVLMYFLKMKKVILAVYDSINDTFKIPEIQNKIHDLEPQVYVESLISPFSQY